MNSAKIFKIHTKIAQIRMIFLVAYLIVYFLEIFSKDLFASVNKISLVFIIILIIIDYLLATQKYRFDLRLIQGIRISMAIWAFTNVIFAERYAAFMSMVFFIMLLMQVLFLTNIVRIRHRLGILYITTIPMLVLSIVFSLSQNHTYELIQVLFFYVSFVFYLTLFIIITSKIISINDQELSRLKGELDKARQINSKENDTVNIFMDHAYEKLSHENSEMLIENLIQQYISSSLEISNLMKLILESLSEALVVNLCSIIVKEEYEEKYQYNTRTICNNFDIEYFNTCIENGSLVEQFKDLRDPFLDNYVDTKEYDFLTGTDIKSLLIYPLVNEGNWLGMLVIGKDTNEYFVDNMSFFERVSTQFSIALMNARIYTMMENMAMKDGLTGIYNRSYMIQKFNECISNVVLNKSPLAVILFDIDKFKNVNDTYGHLFGDEVIRVCANTAEEIANQCNGFAARYGGEEFVIVCQNITLQELRSLVLLLHTMIKQTEVSYRGTTLYVNVSIGVAAFPATCDNPAELIDRADKAMYHSKISGRGKITFDREYE